MIIYKLKNLSSQFKIDTPQKWNIRISRIFHQLLKMLYSFYVSRYIVPIDQISFLSHGDNRMADESLSLSRKYRVIRGDISILSQSHSSAVITPPEILYSNATLITFCSVRDMRIRIFSRPNAGLIFSHDAVIRRGSPAPVYRKHLFFCRPPEPPGC